MAGPEIISTVAAIVQLAEYGFKVHSCIAELVKKVRNQSEILEDLSQQVASIIASAELVRLTSSQTSLTESTTRRCIDKATTLQTRLTAWRMEVPKDGRIAKRSRILGAAAWHSREKEITTLWKEIHQSMMLLNFQASCKALEEKQIDSGTITASMSVGLPSSSSSSFSRISIDIHNADNASAAMDSTLPPRNVDFVGKQELLQDLERRRQPGSRVAIVGLGGIGKTQLALEYAHRSRKDSRGLCIFFASADSELHLEQSYSEFAFNAQLTNADASYTSKCRAVKDFLESSQATDWLMIVDGGDEDEAFFGPKKLCRFLPERVNGFVLFTSRSLQLAFEFVSKAEIVYLSSFSPNESVTLLRSRLGGQHEDLQDMLELADLLEGLPLALSQAASFISTSCDTVPEYLRLYRESEASKLDLLGEGRSHKDGSSSNPVILTWQISFDRIKQKNELAAHLLCFAACLHYHMIPLELFPEAGHTVKFAAAVGLLKNHFMITREASNYTVDMHSLVHLTTRHWMRLTKQIDEYTKLVCDSIWGQFPSDFQSPDQLKLGERYCSHAQIVLSNLSSDVNGEHYVQLASRLSLFFCVRGDYSNALKYARIAANHSAITFGDQNSLTLTAQIDIVVVHRHLGNYEEAEQIAREVLKLQEQVLGQNHMDTLASASCLGLILHDRGQYAAAERLHKETLTSRISLLGSRHNDALRSMNNLGLALKRQGKHEQARDIFQQAFMESSELMGRVDIGTLNIMNNLGLVLQHLKQYTEALEVHNTVFEGRMTLFGLKHPDTLKSRLNIAAVLIDQGTPAEAEPMVHEVVTGYKQLLGDDHPDTLYAKSKLVAVLQGQDRYRDAERTSRNVFETRKIRLGESHPDTIYSKKQLQRLINAVEKLPELGRDDTEAILELD